MFSKKRRNAIKRHKQNLEQGQDLTDSEQKIQDQAARKSPANFSFPFSLPCLQFNIVTTSMRRKKSNFFIFLFFGLETQYSSQISTINRGGFIVFLEDNPAKIKFYNSTSNFDSTRIHRVKYQTIIRDVYKILKHARPNQEDCYIKKVQIYVTCYKCSQGSV